LPEWNPTIRLFEHERRTRLGAGGTQVPTFGEADHDGDVSVIWRTGQRRASRAGTDTDTAAGSLAEIPSVPRDNDHVDDGIRSLDLSGCGVVPVLASDGERVVGWFDYRSALATFR
jgi:hypothetical protein